MTLDANVASRQELVGLVGIGEELADAILNARPFRSLDDLLRVPGIGPVKLDRLEEQGLTIVMSTAIPTEMDRAGNGAGDVGTMPGESAAEAEKRWEEVVLLDAMPDEGAAEAAVDVRYAAVGLMPGESAREADLLKGMPGEAIAAVPVLEAMPGEDVAGVVGLTTMPGEGMGMAEVPGGAAMPGEELPKAAELTAMPGEELARPGWPSYLQGMLLGEIDQEGTLTLRGKWQLSLTVEGTGA